MTTGTPKFINREKDLIPPVLVRAMVLLVVSALALTTFGVLSQRTHAAAPLEIGDAPILAERTFAILADPLTGSASLRELDGTLIPHEGGFPDTVLRVLKRARMQRNVPMDTPVRLVKFDNGQLTLIDTADGWAATLNGFGIDNLAVFSRLLEG